MWDDDLDVNPITYTVQWARRKYYELKRKVMNRYYTWLCANDVHVTYDMHAKFDQKNYSRTGERLKLRSVLRYYRPVMRMTCARCEKRVNTGIPDEYFHGKRDFS